ncbi:MAG: sigma-70 family RNA polymerase sigma factor [Oscillospiraceae bacterium]|nr:sigma-70 family RNA polymerase sigma factor [Oscillospiraceae bacterium]
MTKQEYCQSVLYHRPTVSQEKNTMSPEQHRQKEIYDTYWNYVYTIVFQILRNTGTPEDIEECINDIFTEVFRHYDFSHSETLKAYIGTAARNRALNFRASLTARASHVRNAEEEELSAVASGEDIPASIEQKELTKLLLDSIASLGEPDATILIQKYFYQSKSAEIAKMVHLSPIAVRSRCHRALKKLRKLLKDTDISV